MAIFWLIFKKNLTKTQIKNALMVVSIIKEKIDNSLKGQTYANS